MSKDDIGKSDAAACPTECALLCLELDSDGYPTDESLLRIENYTGSHTKLMSEIAFLFGGYGRCEFEGDLWKIATGGWSGCESVIAALKTNRVFWTMSWQLSRRGGYYEFICKT
jgi:hypothetical protein